jgi:hypothetical protein
MKLQQDVKPGLSILIVDDAYLLKRVTVERVTLRYNEVSGELVPYVEVAYRVLGTHVGSKANMPLTGFLGFRWVFETQQVDPGLVAKAEEYVIGYPGIASADEALREAIFVSQLVHLITEAVKEATL